MKLGSFGSSLCRVSKNGTFVNTRNVTISMLAEYNFWNATPIDLAINDYGYSFRNIMRAYATYKAESIYNFTNMHRFAKSSRTIFDWSVYTRFNNKKHAKVNVLINAINDALYKEGDY